MKNDYATRLKKIVLDVRSTLGRDVDPDTFSQAIDDHPDMTDDLRDFLLEKEKLLNESSIPDDADETFRQDVLRYQHKKGKKAPFVPCDSLNIDFAQMDSKQKNFYFYFREQVLKGNFIHTDDFYILLFATELAFGFRNFPLEKSHKIISDLYEQYENDHDDATDLIFDDILSLCIKYDFPKDALFTAPYAPPQNIAKTNYLIFQSIHLPECHLGLNIIMPLMDIDFEKCKLAKENQLPLYTHCLMLAVNVVNFYLCEEEKVHFYQAYALPEEETFDDVVFENSKFQQREKYKLTMPNYFEDKQLRHIMTEIARHTDNVIRKFFDIRGRLRNIDLEEDIADLVELVVVKQLEEDAKELSDMFTDNLGFSLENMNLQQAEQIKEALTRMNPDDFDEDISMEDLMSALFTEMGQENQAPNGKFPPKKDNILYPDFRKNL